jgi:acetate kinase
MKPVVRLFTINTGSSSLKAALYEMGSAEKRALTIGVERIGPAGGRMRITDAGGATLLDRQQEMPDHEAALQAVFAWLRAERGDLSFDAVGHRVVHGGMHHREPERVTDELVAALRELIVIDPDHLPQALDAIRAVGESYPSVPQVACFDTAFHRRMPRVAGEYALPREYAEAGVLRYGFHGLSYEYIMHALRAEDAVAACGRVIIAHLGNGASMAAVRCGASVDTTMGFTPTGGLVMGTRVGDLDPSVPLYLVRSQGMPPDQISALFNKQAGMLGVSGTSGDMRDLLEKESSDPHAAEAVALFCYQAKKFVGALAAALGGLDTLIFTGGIGEHAAPIRERICAGLEFLGIHLDPRRNAAHAPIISHDGDPVIVRVIPTDEDLIVARHTYHLLTQGGTHVPI